MKSESLQKVVGINKKQLEDVIVGHLYALGVINDDQDVISLEFNPKEWRHNFADIVPLKFKYRNSQEMEVT